MPGWRDRTPAQDRKAASARGLFSFRADARDVTCPGPGSVDDACRLRDDHRQRIVIKGAPRLPSLFAAIHSCNRAKSSGDNCAASTAQKKPADTGGQNTIFLEKK
jgi:hypothetical protein